VICNEEDTGGRARLTVDEERVLYYVSLYTEQRSNCVGSQVGQ